MYTRLRHMIFPQASQMTRRVNQLMADGKIPNTSEADVAVRALLKLRQATHGRRIMDPILWWEDCFQLRPSEKIEGRRSKVRVAKAACLAAKIPAWVIDEIFPEPPRLTDSLRERISRRWALHRQRNLHLVEGGTAWWRR